MFRWFIFTILLRFSCGDGYRRPFYEELKFYPTSGRGYEVEEDRNEDFRFKQHPRNLINDGNLLRYEDDSYEQNYPINNINVGNRIIDENDFESNRRSNGGHTIYNLPKRLPNYNPSRFPEDSYRRHNVISPRLYNNYETNQNGYIDENLNQYGYVKPDTNRDYLVDNYERYVPNQSRNSYEIAQMPYHQTSGGEISNKAFHKNDNERNDQRYHKINGRKDIGSSRNEAGLLQNQVSLLNNKVDNEYFNEEKRDKKVNEDKKLFNGGDHYNQQGQNENENKLESNRRKGHVIKGFKNSHHKDESEKTEEFYDETHDENGRLTYSNNSGDFGENSESAYNSLKENKDVAINEVKNEGHRDLQEIIKKNEEAGGKNSNDKFFDNSKVYGVNYGDDNQSLLGHQESKRIFEQRPHSVPFF